MTLIQSVDSARLAEAIQREAAKCGRTIGILLEIHVAAEETKTGWDVGELMEYIRTAPFAQMPNVCVRGVMGIATNTDDGETIRRDFNELRRCFDLLQPYFGRGSTRCRWVCRTTIRWLSSAVRRWCASVP